MSGRSAYVYYRVVPGRASLAAARIDALLQTLAAFCSQPPRRLLRCDDRETWMEIYEGISDWPAFERALQAQEAGLQQEAWIDGRRHVECFMPADGV